ncbi:hypothetical protein [Sphingopyxis sp.]|uniref:hypothetical protein n=1 Tax=Sphingopyxis sp. TaxID=1908224 RepID=UPI0025D4D2AF|nr:hypothetical protein [Sphingopyxis sp.]
MRGWIGIVVLAGAGLAGGLAFAQKAAPMTRAEAIKLYAAGGFPISADGKSPTNRCGKPANPRITFVDLNGDKVKDALFTDSDSDTGTCYGSDKRFFAMAVKERDGSWRGLGGWTGTAQATGSDRNGWLTITWTSNGASRPLAYNGVSYTTEIAPSPAAPPPAAKPPASAPPTASAARDAAIFRAAGFQQTRRGWESGCDDPSSGSVYEPGAIDQVKDLNGDGRPEAVVTEGGSLCYGNTGTAFSLVSQQADGSWKLVYESIGIPEFLATKGVGGWPDISVGGPGFCFPVLRWNGRAYVRHRMEYEGKPCKG